MDLIDKIIKIGLIVLCTQSYGFGQTTFEYVYDNAGNRTTRTVVTLKSATIDTTLQVKGDSSNQNEQAIPPKNGQSSAIGNTTVTLYPNPTVGIIEVAVENEEPQNAVEIWLFDLKGLLLLHKNSSGLITEIDLLNQPAGSYIAKIIVNGKVTEWKIIKE
ncbi:MAG: T9SS type A sorting domain-containing protein [Salinivirgaceae bacterium]|nr:T9SS type A sorting domain-containing protein [Salinivirgaceae bacterium]